MNQPNLFRYATKELSQDAVICWLVACANSAEGALRECGRSFVKALFRAGSQSPASGIPVLNPTTRVQEVHAGPCSVEEVELPRKQYRHIDVYFQARVDGKQVSFLIEDKTKSGPHSDQLTGYLEVVASDGRHEDLIKPIYFKTGFLFDDERLKVEEDGFRVFKLEDLVQFLKIHHAQANSDVLSQYYEHMSDELTDRNGWLRDWDLRHDFVQWEFLKRVSEKVEERREHWRRYLPVALASPREEKRPHMWRGRSRGGTPWTQYRFSGHMYWRLDSEKPVRLMVDQSSSGWNDALLQLYRDSFEAARQDLGQLKRGSIRLKGGNDVTVGSVATEQGGANDKLIEPIARLHEKCLEFASLGAPRLSGP